MSSVEKSAKAPLNASMAEPDPPLFVLREPISRITIGGEWNSQAQIDRTGLHHDILGRSDLPHRAVLPVVSTAAHFDFFSACSGDPAGQLLFHLVPISGSGCKKEIPH
jgi:hypothetical protein